MKGHFENSDQETLTWCYLFGVSAMLAAISRTGRASSLSGGACDPDDTARVISILVPFIAGGMRAALAAQSNVGKPKLAKRRSTKSKP
jgi:hypothetical protein